jgi:hypothetical protein
MSSSEALTSTHPETGLEQLEQATPADVAQLAAAVALPVEAVADLADSVGGLQHPAGDDRVEPLDDLSPAPGWCGCVRRAGR